MKDVMRRPKPAHAEINAAAPSDFDGRAAQARRPWHPALRPRLRETFRKNVNRTLREDYRQPPHAQTRASRATISVKLGTLRS